MLRCNESCMHTCMRCIHARSAATTRPTNSPPTPAVFSYHRAYHGIYCFNLPWPCLIMENSFRPGDSARPGRLSRRFCLRIGKGLKRCSANRLWTLLLGTSFENIRILLFIVSRDNIQTSRKRKCLTGNVRWKNPWVSGPSDKIEGLLKGRGKAKASRTIFDHGHTRRNRVRGKMKTSMTIFGHGFNPFTTKMLNFTVKEFNLFLGLAAERNAVSKMEKH